MPKPKIPRVHLGRREVAALKPEPGKPVTFWDADLPGFGLRFTKAGKPSWIVFYRVGEGGRAGIQRVMTIGRPPMKADVAREKAEEVLARVTLGEDPLGVKHAARRAETVEQLVRAYLDEHVRPARKASTAALYDLYIRRHIAPRTDGPDTPLLPGALGGRKAISVTRQDVAKLHREVGKKQPRSANATVTLLAAAFAWGAKHGAFPETLPNPARGVGKFKEESRERFLTTDEFMRLGEALRLAETTGLPWEPDPAKKVQHAPKAHNRHVVIDQFAIAAIRLLTFSGARLREILHLRWSEVDMERGLLFLSTSKTGKKTIVLTAPALEILAGLPRLGKYVIAGESAGSEGERPRADLHRPWARIIAHAKLDGLRIHDLRHSFASVGVADNLGLPVIGKLLGHADVKTTQKYAHLQVDPVRHAGNAIANKIKNAMSDPGVVVPFPGHGG